MSEHDTIQALIPLYVSGKLDAAQRRALEDHFDHCPECREDLVFWRAMAGEVIAEDRILAAPAGLADRALVSARSSRSVPRKAEVTVLRAMRRIGELLHSQMPLVHREIWPASALIMALGFIAALISEQSMFLYALAPMVAAGCVSLIYGPENDPAFELALSTPTSPRQILLARLVLVFGYNLALVLMAGLGLLLMLPSQSSHPLLGSLLLSWLAPMTFLSAAALTFSLWIGTSNAIFITYGIWLARLLMGLLRSPQAELALPTSLVEAMSAFQQFWQTPLLLFVLAFVLFGAAVWLVGHQDRGLLNPA